jgi:hypothetical protein
MSTFQTIDLATLTTITGGQAQQQGEPPMDDGPQPRTWGQVGREYAAACVTGAGQSLIFGGRPRSVRDAATNAAVGCAMGVGMKAVEDVSGAMSGGR